MDETIFMKLCQMNAALVRVEGMKAENKEREICGLSLAYSEKEFGYEANFIDSLWRN
jgi:hypothetical protein